jgi:hypothetical protein
LDPEVGKRQRQAARPAPGRTPPAEPPPHLRPLARALQNKLQRAQQQRQLVQDFAADIQRSMEAELTNHETAAAAQARLRYARARLEELHAINAERQRRVDEALAEAMRLQVRAWA